MREEDPRAESAPADGFGMSSAASPGTDEVLSALRRISNGSPPLAPTAEGDPFALADALFDRASSFDFAELVHLTSRALLAELDAFAVDHVRQERLLLDPCALAEETVLRLVTGVLEGGRARPLRAWARRCLRVAADAAREDRSIAPLDDSNVPAHRRPIAAAAAGVLNGLDAPMRELAWLAWVELLPPEQIHRRTGRPLEDVERDLVFILERAHAAIEAARRASETSHKDPGERAHVREREEGGSA